jgi:hypothetical protein
MTLCFLVDGGVSFIAIATVNPRSDLREQVNGSQASKI